MEKFAFKLRLKEKDQQEEYKKRHDEIWPEMIEVLDEAGIKNYSIWNTGTELFGYYEVDDLEYAEKVQSESEVVAEWNQYMQDLLVSKVSEKGRVEPVIEPLDLMFYKE